MIPLWMIVVACTGGGKRWGSYVSFLRVLFFFIPFSFSPSVFHGWACVFFLDFFGGYRLKCRVINYSFFITGLRILIHYLALWFWVWDF